jgi:hypothetical protein
MTSIARLVSQITSEDALKIQDFMAAFDKHKQSLDWALGVHVAFTINNACDIAQRSLEAAKDTLDTARHLGVCSSLDVSKALRSLRAIGAAEKTQSGEDQF